MKARFFLLLFSLYLGDMNALLGAQNTPYTFTDLVEMLNDIEITDNKVRASIICERKVDFDLTSDQTTTLFTTLKHPINKAIIDAIKACRALDDIVMSIHGSHTLGEYLMPRLVFRFLKDHLNFTDIKLKQENTDFVVISGFDSGFRKEVRIRSNGSLKGYSDLKLDRCDILMSSTMLSDEKISHLLKQKENSKREDIEHKIAKDRIVMIVNKKNPINQINFKRLANYLRYKKNRKWKELEDGNDNSIHIYSRKEGSGTYNELLKTIGIEKIELPAGEYDSHSEVSNQVASDILGLGYVSRPYVGNAKEVYVGGDNEKVSLRDLYLYIPVTASEIAKQFVAYAKEKNAQALVKELEFLPVYATGTPEDVGSKEQAIGKEGCRGKEKEFLFAKIYFRSGEKGYKDDRGIRRIVGRFEQCEDYEVKVYGYADNFGPPSINILLSRDRAESVANLLRKYGATVDPKNVQGRGIVPLGNETPEGRKENRRVEIRMSRVQ